MKKLVLITSMVFLMTPLLSSCENDSVNEEISEFELLKTDKDDNGTIGNSGGDDDEDHN